MTTTSAGFVGGVKRHAFAHACEEVIYLSVDVQGFVYDRVIAGDRRSVADRAFSIDVGFFQVE
jgi:hypothetical protein